MIDVLGRLAALPLLGLWLLLRAMSLVCGALFVALAVGCLIIAGRSSHSPPRQDG